MEPLRRAMTQVWAVVSKMTPTQKLLIGAVAVILVMTLFLVQLYTGRPSMVALMPGASGEQQQAAVRYIQAAGFEYETREGQIYVPVGSQRVILAQMAENNAMPGDSRILFDNLINKQSWTMSQRQNQQLEVIAVQNELSAIISRMSGVKSASVILNIPEKRSLGQPSAEPSASATIFPTRPLTSDTVDSIAHLVAGSRGLDPKNVRVIDASTNRQYRARDEDNMTASTYLEFVAAVESRKQSQIHEMLAAYIPGVIVTVHAQVDVTRRRTETKSVLPEGKGSASLLAAETTTTREDRSASSGGEPGPRSNTREDITGLGGAAPPASKEATSDSQFNTEFGREVRVVEDPRGNPTKINAVVNIPRSYFAEVWRTRQPAANAANAAPNAPAAEPTDNDLQPIVDAETARIKREVELQIDTSAGAETTRGEVQVSMVPLTIPTASAAPQSASMLGIPTGTLAVDGLVRTVGLGALAVVALGMVVMTAMRASKREPLPTAAELVGVPPALEGDADLIGEAGEADSALQGLELSEDELRTQKVSEQVAEMVKEKPQDAARLVGRWIAGT
ncbi:MAG: flagellar M-ring protein FliF C-terminal domain-containing protein [Planctomycetota bacterium]|nr:flagellar M-ring protein FliF C-terminal domain-containing protein [Planctomycetota bacterium]